MRLASLVLETGVRASPWHPAGPPARAHYRQLAPGVWSLRTVRWVHAGVLDSHESLPAASVDAADAQRQAWPVPDWHGWALCGGMSFAAFFGAASDERPTMKRSEISAARRICAGCPVTRECLTWALSNGERFGVWGGTSGRQRTRMRSDMRVRQVTQETVVEEWFARWLGT